MEIRWLFATLHLLALGIGLGAIWARGRALHGNLDGEGLRRVFLADTFWGLEKGSAYYLHNEAFLFKMALLGLILLLEVLLMVTLIQWRVRTSRGELLNTTRAATLARISVLQAGLVVLMVFAATAMARLR